MNKLLILLVLVGSFAHADYSYEQFERDGRAWEKITDAGAPLETPEYHPEPSIQPMQSDTDWNVQMKAMDLESSPAYSRGY